jgi:hypothetical protein
MDNENTGYGELAKCVESLIETKGIHETREYLTQISCDVPQKEAYEKLIQDFFHIRLAGRQWRVLEKKDDMALLISEDIIKLLPYNKEYVSITWEKCTLRGWLNGEFLNEFSPQEKAAIVETNLTNKDNQKIPGGNDTVDRVFLLSLDEVQKYFENDGDRIAKNSEGQAVWWWLRSPGYHRSVDAAIVGGGGSVHDSGFDVYTGYGGVRPALWLNLKSLNL